MRYEAGRDAYSSAMNCLIETVETYTSHLESSYLGVQFVEKCAEILMSCNADISKVRTFKPLTTNL